MTDWRTDRQLSWWPSFICTFLFALPSVCLVQVNINSEMRDDLVRRCDKDEVTRSIFNAAHEEIFKVGSECVVVETGRGSVTHP